MNLLSLKEIQYIDNEEARLIIKYKELSIYMTSFFNHFLMMLAKSLLEDKQQYSLIKDNIKVGTVSESALNFAFSKINKCSHPFYINLKTIESECSPRNEIYNISHLFEESISLIDNSVFEQIFNNFNEKVKSLKCNK